MMLATLMVHLTPGTQLVSLLRLAGDVAARIGVRKVIGISALRPLQIFIGPDAYVTQDVFEQDWRMMEKEIGIAEKLLREAFAGKIALEWRSTITSGLVSDYVAKQMRAADLLVTLSAPRDLLFDTDRYLNVADLVLKAGRPVLVAGPDVTRLDLDNAMVGWTDSREARRAAEDAVPLLQMARKVTVVEVASRDELAAADARLRDVVEWLKGHDISAEARVEGSGDEDSAVLAGLAQDLRAGLLVAGAYGHSRLREWALGGVTRDLLLQPRQCSFISH
jgi:nucleotide-binding universal stress UspA family protein